MGNQKYKQAHREQGLCANCSSPVHPGYSMCLKHMRSHNKSTKKWYRNNYEVYLRKQKERKELRRQQGLCAMCGAPLEEDNKCISCCNCRDKFFYERVENAVIIV